MVMSPTSMKQKIISATPEEQTRLLQHLLSSSTQYTDSLEISLKIIVTTYTVGISA